MGRRAPRGRSLVGKDEAQSAGIHEHHAGPEQDDEGECPPTRSADENGRCSKPSAGERLDRDGAPEHELDFGLHQNGDRTQRRHDKEDGNAEPEQ